MLYCTLLLIQLLCKIIYDHRIYVLFLVIFILNPYLANRVNSVITCFSTYDMDVLYLLHSVPVLSPGRSYVDVIRDMVEYHVFSVSSESVIGLGAFPLSAMICSSLSG